MRYVDRMPAAWPWPPSPHLAPRLRKEKSSKSAPPLGLRGLVKGEEEEEEEQEQEQEEEEQEEQEEQEQEEQEQEQEGGE